MRNDYKQIANEIENFIAQECKGFNVVIGISGGIDSALVAKLAVKALNKERVFGLVMPSSGTSKEDLRDAINFALKLGIEHQVLHIDSVAKQIFLLTDPQTRIERENIDGRIRSMLLYSYANKRGKTKVLGTINRSEWMTGYFPKHALVGDLLPIAGIFKTQVRGVAKAIGVPKEICDKMPKCGLNLSCAEIEDFYRVPLSEIDSVLFAIDSIKSKKLILSAGYRNEHITKVWNLFKRSSHKRIYKLAMPKINRKKS